MGATENISRGILVAVDGSSCCPGDSMRKCLRIPYIHAEVPYRHRSEDVDGNILPDITSIVPQGPCPCRTDTFILSQNKSLLCPQVHSTCHCSVLESTPGLLRQTDSRRLDSMIFTRRNIRPTHLLKISASYVVLQLTSASVCVQWSDPHPGQSGYPV